LRAGIPRGKTDKRLPEYQKSGKGSSHAAISERLRVALLLLPLQFRLEYTKRTFPCQQRFYRRLAKKIGGKVWHGGCDFDSDNVKFADGR
jgi:hypothetical protein